MQKSNFRDNYPSEDPEHFFREAIFVPYLDHLIVEMEDRFFDQKQKCRSLWDLIPKYCDALSNTAQDLERLLEIYQEDINNNNNILLRTHGQYHRHKSTKVVSYTSAHITETVFAHDQHLEEQSTCN